MTNPKSKSKMIKALRKWLGNNDGEWSCRDRTISLQCYSKSEITKLFNEAIAKRANRKIKMIKTLPISDDEMSLLCSEEVNTEPMSNEDSLLFNEAIAKRNSGN